MTYVATALELLGLALLCVAAFLVAVPLGVAAVGAAVLVLGVALGRAETPTKENRK